MNNPFTKIILKIVLTITVIGAAFYFVMMPKLDELAQNQVATERVSTDLANADAKLTQLNKMAKNKADLDNTEDLVFGYLPEEPSPSTFIVNMEQTSSQIPVIIDSLSVNDVNSASSAKSGTATTAQSKKTTSEKALTFNASFKAPYDKVLTFLQKMEQMPRFNTIENITINNYDPTSNSVNFKADGKIYYGN